MKIVLPTHFALLLAAAVTSFWACEHDAPIPAAAPCPIALPLSALPDSCFELPSGPTGPYFNPPFDFIYRFLSASNSEVDVFYYLRQDYDLGSVYGNQKIFKHNLCTGETNLVYEIENGSYTDNLSVNSEGEILFQPRPLRPILIASASINPPVEVLPAGDYISTRWINNDSFIISRWVSGSNFEPLLIDQSGNEAPLPLSILKEGAFDFQDGKYVIYFNANSPHYGYLGVYNIETDELTLIEDIRANYGLDNMNIFWLNDTLIIGYTFKEVFKYNIATQEIHVLHVNGDCESRNYNSFSPAKLKDREDIVLLSRRDYIYNALGQYRLQYRISVLDITTGEEQILELD